MSKLILHPEFKLYERKEKPLCSSLQVAETKGWFLTDASNLSELPLSEAKNQGFVYALEFGEKIKIGRTKNLAKRMKTLQLNANNCSVISPGKVAFSPSHSNYTKNEAILHSFFKDKRRGKSELFDLCLDEFIQSVPILTFEKIIPVEKDMNSLIDELLRQDWEARTGLPFEMYLNLEKAKTPEEKLAAQKKLFSAQPKNIALSESVPSIHDIKEVDFKKQRVILKDGTICEMTGALSFLRQKEE